ncbi:protein brambleberry isoform X2 [Engraulis encrasicolus]|uniref:protein brambleberry isoform X2 n=1 Tax=Engraulis encrasicolus TaxID=184585 RepID=UPI002FD6FD3A
MMHQRASSLVFWGLFWVILSQCPTASAFFDWLKEQPQIAPTPPPPPPVYAESTDPPTFEMRVVEERFLAEGNMMQLSPLDSCHLQVISQLKSTCDGLSEEGLAKLGVALFNCQAEVEGRRTYPCTEDMSLKECTADMDSDTWNAYHIVSNRARSVCYATRQQHFRRRAELTVNALIATATSQLHAMEDLKEGQEELRDMTAASLDKLLEGHSALRLQQGALKEGQEQLDASISSNLDRLAQEKALISTGQQLVSQLIQGIAQRMENVSEQLKTQGSDVQDGHQAILDDLAQVRGRAQDIYSKMQDNMVGFLQQQNDTARFYSELMGKLERMNGTLGYLLVYLDNMQGKLEDRLHIIQRYLSWAGLNICAVWTCVMHTGYFLLSAVLLSFLQCPTFSRLSLIVTVPLNAVAEVNQQPAFDLCTLTALLFALSLVRWLVVQVLSVLSQVKGDMGSQPPQGLCWSPGKATKEGSPILQPRGPPSSTPQKDHLDYDTGLELDGDPSILASSPPQSYWRSRFAESGLDAINHSTPTAKIRSGGGGVTLENVSQRNLTAALDTVDQSCNSSMASNGSVTGRALCNGTTKLGQPCKKRAVRGQNFCRVHSTY